MVPTDIASNPPTSPRPLEIPSGSPVYISPDSSHINGSPQVGSIDCFEHVIEKLVRILEKVDIKNKPEDARSEATKYIEAEKRKVRTSKLKYRLVDKVYVTLSTVTVLLTHLYLIGMTVHSSTKSWNL